MCTYNHTIPRRKFDHLAILIVRYIRYISFDGSLFSSRESKYIIVSDEMLKNHSWKIEAEKQLFHRSESVLHIPY
jgi:hypothetical protein